MSFLILIPSHWSFVPRWRSVRYIGSKIASTSEVDRFATVLTGLADSSLFSVVSVVCSVSISNTGIFVVMRVSVCLATVNLTMTVVTGTIFVSVSMAPLFPKLTTLISVVAWFLQS